MHVRTGQVWVDSFDSNGPQVILVLDAPEGTWDGISHPVLNLTEGELTGWHEGSDWETVNGMVRVL